MRQKKIRQGCVTCALLFATPGARGTLSQHMVLASKSTLKPRVKLPVPRMIGTVMGQFRRGGGGG